MRTILALVLTLLTFVVPVHAQQWDRSGGSMQTTASTTDPAVIINQNGTGKILSLRSPSGTEVWSVDPVTGTVSTLPISFPTITATTAFVLGAATTAGVRLDLETGVLAVREGDDSAYGDLKARTLESTTSIGAGTFIQAGASSPISWSGRSAIDSPADTQLRFGNGALTQTATLTVPTGTGNVIPVTVAKGRATAQTGANASVSTFTVGAADASFAVSANVRVTTATTHAFTVTCAYTDEENTARTLTMPFTLVAGAAIVTSIANAAGTVPYMGINLHIRAKAGTAITIATTGTFTSVAYNVEGIIRKID